MVKNNSILSSTCHICLEKFNYKPNHILKKCCPTKAFICNKCWIDINNSSSITKCPICKNPLKVRTNKRYFNYIVLYLLFISFIILLGFIILSIINSFSNQGSYFSLLINSAYDSFLIIPLSMCTGILTIFTLIFVYELILYIITI